MAKNRFRYLFTCYKSNQLTERDRNDWLRMAVSEDFRDAIESDIDAFMTEYLASEWFRENKLREAWRNILHVVVASRNCENSERR